MKFPLEIQNPQGLWLFLTVIPLVLLYILKVRRTRVTVGSTWLWASARRDLLARSPFKKFIFQIPFLLQLLALLLLAFALMSPATRHRAILGDHIAIVIDSSASMGALDPKSGLTRLELAKRTAKDAISALSPGSRAFIMAAGRDVRVVAPLNADPKRLNQAIDLIQVQSCEGDLQIAVSLAVDRLRQLGGSKRILVISDGNLANQNSLKGVRVPVEFYLVGKEIENAAIVRADVRSGFDPGSKQEEVQAFVMVGNFGTKPRDLFVTMRLANVTEPLASRRLLVKPGEKLPVVLTFNPTKGDQRKGLLLELSPKDAMPVDDVVFARVPAGRKLPVVLISKGGSPWISRAFASDPLVDLWKGTPEQLAQAKVASDSLFVYDGVCPARPPAGDLLVVNPPTGGCLGVKVGKEVAHPPITSWSNGDTRLRYLTLDGVNISTAKDLEVENNSQSLVRSQHATLIADISMPGRSGTMVGFDVGDSDWPLKASFVLFVRNIVEIARSHRAQGAMGPVRSGQPIRVPIPADVEKVEISFPGNKKTSEVMARAGLAIVTETDQTGLYLISWKGRQAGSALVPVNLVSEKESDLRARIDKVESDGGKIAAGSQLIDAHTNWTYVVALAALLFVLLDVWWLTKKPKKSMNPIAFQQPPVPERRSP
jgi:hypothetical protein